MKQTPACWADTIYCHSLWLIMKLSIWKKWYQDASSSCGSAEDAICAFPIHSWNKICNSSPPPPATPGCHPCHRSTCLNSTPHVLCALVAPTLAPQLAAHPCHMLLHPAPWPQTVSEARWGEGEPRAPAVLLQELWRGWGEEGWPGGSPGAAI